VALSNRHFSESSEAEATATLEADGRVRISHNAADFGQGIYTMLGLVAAQTLGLAQDQVIVEKPDTSNSLAFVGSMAQRTTVEMGKAVQSACEDLRAQIVDFVTRTEGDDGWEWREGAVRRDASSRSLGVVACQALPTVLVGHGSDKPKAAPVPGRSVFQHWAVGAAAAEVEVDTSTGDWQVLRYVAVADAGHAIHPASARGQVEGGVVMGIGLALGEEIVALEGQVVNANVLQYRLPVSTDIPAQLDVVIVENGDGPGPFGAKGMAQTSIPCVSAAVGNAIADAVGVRLRETPFTPERILRAWGKIGSVPAGVDA
jgi:CO/xanthine dehydrogenase Mo-binding subunit